MVQMGFSLLIMNTDLKDKDRDALAERMFEDWKVVLGCPQHLPLTQQQKVSDAMRRIWTVQSELEIRQVADIMKMGEMVSRLRGRVNRLETFLLRFIQICAEQGIDQARPLAESCAEFIEACHGDSLPSDEEFRTRVVKEVEAKKASR